MMLLDVFVQFFHIENNPIFPSFLARLHFSAEELLLYPRCQRRRPCHVGVRVRVRVGVGVHMQNVRANVKVLEF